MEPRTARSAIIRDDSTSEYERAATIPVSVPKPAPIPESGFKERVPESAVAWYNEPTSWGSKVKRQEKVGSAFFI